MSGPEIAIDDVIPLLLRACPSFVPVWEGQVKAEFDVSDDEFGTGRLHYFDAGAFVRHVAHLIESGDVAELPATFEAIEQLHTDGNREVRNLAVVGYLEDLQNTHIVRPLDPEADIRPLLGPVSTEAWDRLNRAWAGDGTANPVPPWRGSGTQG